ncbi:MAG: ATP-binding protein [Planctomycetota bacterium]
MSSQESPRTDADQPQRNSLEHGLTSRLMARLHTGQVFSLIASITSHPVLVSDVEGRVVWVNQAFECLSGWRLEEIRHLQPSEFLYGPETNPETAGLIRRQMQVGASLECEILNYRRDGMPCRVSLEGHPISDEDVGHIGYFSILTDVSARQRIECELRHDRDLLKLISDSLTRFISNPDESTYVYGDMLFRLLKLTSSEYGFLGEVRCQPDGNLYLPEFSLAGLSWSQETRKRYEKSYGFGLEFRHLATLFGSALHMERPLIANAPSPDEQRGGLPAGHPPLRRFLGLPIQVDGATVGMVGLSNSPEPYTDGLVRYLEPALACLGQLILARRRESLRRQTEASLAEAEEMLNETGEIASIGAWQLDLETNTLKWSKQTCRLHEVADDYQPELEAAINFYQEEARLVISEAIRNAIENGRPWDIELPFVTARGQHRWARVIGHIRMLSGRPRGLYGSFQDVTQRRMADAERDRLQAQFIQSQKLESVGRLAGGIAHDFNNMLAVIAGHAEMMLMDSSLTSMQRTHLKAIQAASQRSAEMTRQLLTFARRQSAAPQKLDLNKTVRQLLEFLRKSVGENIRIDLIQEPDLWTVNIDPVQVDQLLAQLCMNARDAMPSGGRIMISTRNLRVEELRSPNASRRISGDCVVLTISDNGPGISHDVISRLYEPFTTTKPVGQGPGLGLATVYGIVQQNEGAIEIESDHGSGSIFRIDLPRIVVSSKASRENGGSPSGQRPLQILLIEDEPALKKLGRMYLQQLGHKVQTADCGEEGLRILQASRRPIQLIITDMILEGISGEDLVRKALEIQSDLRFVFMSGHSTSEQQRKWSGHWPLLAKPFELHQLVGAIQEAVSMPRDAVSSETDAIPACQEAAVDHGR